MRSRNSLQCVGSKRLPWFSPLLAVATFLISGCGWSGELTTNIADSTSSESLFLSDSKNLSPAAAAILIRPAGNQNMQVQSAGFFGYRKRTQDQPLYSEQEKNSVVEAFKQTDSADVKAALLPGFARQQNYTAMPLIIDSVKADSPVLSGRAIATAEHLLGVRYNVEVSELRNREMRCKTAGMIEKDWQQLQHYPRFKTNID
jgi:hypothetical protein